MLPPFYEIITGIVFGGHVSYITLEECFQLKVPDIDLNSQRVQIRKSKPRENIARIKITAPEIINNVTKALFEIAEKSLFKQ